MKQVKTEVYIMFKKLFTRLRNQFTAKQIVVAGAFVLALSGAVGLGLVVKQQSSVGASGSRDCSRNSIDYVNMHGGCGATTPGEWIADLRSNQPGDLQSSAAAFGTSTGDYTRFANTARSGMTYKDGRVVVDGQVVMTNAWSVGRYQKPKAWKSHGYWANFNRDVFLSNAIPVMVMFDSNGVAESVVMKPCGNLMWGTKVTPSYDCKVLNASAVPGTTDTYDFSSVTVASNNASIVKLVYEFGDGTSATTTSQTAVVRHTYAQPGNYITRVRVFVKLPGQQVRDFVAVNCEKQITVEAPKYVCVGLVARALDEEMQNFRFTAQFTYANGPTPQSATFNVDGKTIATSTKQEVGNSYYFDATFTDTAEHTVTAKVNFVLKGNQVSTTEDCVAKVTSKKKPMCTVPGKENFPPNAPECHQECKPGVPVGDVRCTPPKELPKTGVSGVAGLFAGTSAIGALAHRVLRRKR